MTITPDQYPIIRDKLKAIFTIKDEIKQSNATCTEISNSIVTMIYPNASKDQLKKGKKEVKLIFEAWKNQFEESENPDLDTVSVLIEGLLNPKQ